MTTANRSRRPGRLYRARKPLLAALLIAWPAALVASHIPAEKLPQMRVGDANLHFAGFYALAGLFWLTLSAYARSRPARALLVLAIMPLYAAFDELTQPLFNRNAAWGDWLADIAGAAAAVVCLEIVALMLQHMPAPDKAQDHEP
ncbi:MAG TPA: VanZ family protein [Phycisphaerae bacterium]|nr:VanZ family protein [Phycisphaerae bacterium]